MKKIVIFHENVDKVELIDLDNKSLDTYVKELSSILELGNISILRTTSSSVILRPSKVVSILVEEIEETKDKEIEEVGKSIDEEVDIITEG